MLKSKGLKLDGVIEIKIDEDILIRRIESRVFEMRNMGMPIRPDDTPEVLRQRLGAYRSQTAPLGAYYKDKGLLRTVDGMASIEEVTGAIGRALADAAAFGAPKPKRRPPRLNPRANPSPRARKLAAKPPSRGQGQGPRQGGFRSRPESGEKCDRTPEIARKGSVPEVDEVTGNPLIHCTFCRTEYERCQPRRDGDGVALLLARSLQAIGTAPPRHRAGGTGVRSWPASQA